MNDALKALYGILCEAADAGARAPTRSQMRLALHIGHFEFERRWDALVRDGHIRVEVLSRTAGYIVTITATGASTARGAPPRSHAERQAYRQAITAAKVDEKVSLAERIERDQQRIRSQRIGWLEVEREKYALPRLGRLPEDMAA